MATYNNADCDFFKRQALAALRMARAYSPAQRMRVIWQERVADYREALLDQMRRRQGWPLEGRVTYQRYQSQGGRGFVGKYW